MTKPFSFNRIGYLRITFSSQLFPLTFPIFFGILCLGTSVLRCPASSALSPPSSVLRPLPSVLRPLSSNPCFVITSTSYSIVKKRPAGHHKHPRIGPAHEGRFYLSCIGGISENRSDEFDVTALVFSGREFNAGNATGMETGAGVVTPVHQSFSTLFCFFSICLRLLFGLGSSSGMAPPSSLMV